MALGIDFHTDMGSVKPAIDVVPDPDRKGDLGDEMNEVKIDPEPSAGTERAERDRGRQSELDAHEFDSQTDSITPPPPRRP